MEKIIMLRLVCGIIMVLFSMTTVSATSVPPLPDEGLKAEGKKDWQAAVSIYLSVLLDEPKRVDLWLRVASIEHQLKNNALAIDAYKHAIKLLPDDPLLHKTLSEIYAESNQPKDALFEINQAVNLKPYDIGYLFARAKIANWNKDFGTTLDSYQRLLARSKIEKIPVDAYQLNLDIAGIENQLHHYPESIEAYKEAIKLSPHNALLYQQLSQTYAVLQDPIHALEAIEKALMIEPNNRHYLTTKAVLAMWLKDSKLALKTYQQILKITPNDKTALEGVALIVHQNQRSAPSKLGTSLSLFDQFIAKSNDAAVLHHYAKAASAMKKAISLKPRDPTLYKKLSEIEAMAKRPKLAITAINSALRLNPTNINYWRAKAKLTAWVGDKIETERTYTNILKLKPYDQDAMLNVAHTLAWQGKTDAAIAAYERFLCLYPNDAEGFIQYAAVKSWTRNFIVSFKALDRYRQLKGETMAYMQTRARVLALAGRYQSALALNNLLLRKRPHEPYLLSTEVTAFSKANQTNQAIFYLNQLNKITPNERETKNLSAITLTPLRSNINAEADFAGASDTTRVDDFPVGVQYFLSPTTSLLFQGLYEYASASVLSGLEAINGHTSIFDESVRVGFTTQFEAINIKGLVGGLKVQHENNHGIYDALLNTNLGERAQFSFESSHDLFRPYLVPQSPRLISLQVMEERNGVSLQWQPSLQKYLNVVTSYSTLTDDNNYWHTNVWPKARVYGTEHWLVTLGVDGDFWRFKRRAMDGYYSPLFFQGYEGTVEAYYAYSDNIGCSVSGGFGAQKDETFPHLFYEEDLAMQLFIGILRDWELQIKGGFTLRENPTHHNYRYWSGGVILTRRF